MMRSSPLLICLLATACRQIPDVSAEKITKSSTSTALVAGANAADPAVFLLIELLTYQYNGAEQILIRECSSTLIGSKTMLTSAHCVDSRSDILQYDPNVPSSLVTPAALEIWALDGIDLTGVLSDANAALADPSDPLSAARAVLKSAGAFEVVGSAFPDAWNPDDPGAGADIGLALLDRAPSVATKPFNIDSASVLVGKKVRLLGYGINDGSAATGAGRLRELDNTVASVGAGAISIGDGVCEGDSGGPSFFTFSDGVERVVGVHSHTRGDDCTNGTDSEVDTYTDFIEAYLTAHDSPCSADRVCNNGCPSDPDCATIGSACTAPSDCASGSCIADAQHADTYCSTTCSVTADCGGDLICRTSQCQKAQLPWARLGESCADTVAVCITGFDCVNMSNGTQICWEQCTQDSDCATGQTCSQTIDGGKYCSQKNLATESAPTSATKTGCRASGPPLWLVILAVALVVRRKR